MMAISFINSTAKDDQDAAGVTAVTANKPTNTAQGDVMIAFHYGALVPRTPPSGWVQVGSNIDAGTVIRLSVFYKVAGGSEPSTYVFGSDADTHVQGVHIHTYRGVDTTTPIQTSTSANSTTAEALATGNISPTGTTWIVSAAAERDDNGTMDTHTTSDGSDAERTDSGAVSTGGTFTRKVATYDSNRDISAGTYSRTLTTNSGTTIGHIAWIGALNQAAGTSAAGGTATIANVSNKPTASIKPTVQVIG